MRRHTVAIVLAVTACHHGGPVHHPGEEYLAGIRFEGNHAISSDSLRGGLALARVKGETGVPDPYMIGADRDRVVGTYVREGYFDVDVHARVERAGGAVTVVYRIEEGPRARTRVVITGVPDDPGLRDKVRAKLPLADGAPFSYAPYDRAKDPLRQVLEDAGYAHATLDAHVIADHEHHEAIVELAFDAGPKSHFGTITISGVPEQLEEAVRARITFKPGDKYSTVALAETQRAIYGMQRFSTVRVQPDKSDGDRVDVRIDVGEGARHELSLGGGFGIDPLTYEVRGRVGYTIDGWPSPLSKLELEGRPAYAYLRDGSGYEPRIRALARLSRMDLFHPFITGEAEVGYNYLVVEPFTSYGPHVGLFLRTRPWHRRLRLRVGWQLEQFNFRDLSPLIAPELAQQLGLDATERVGELQQAIALDLRDSPIEPHEGFYAEVRAAEGSPFLLGTSTFVQLTPEVRGYVPLGGDLVLAARARAGEFFGDVPVTERYYGGGANSQRGFSERRLAPTLVGLVNGHLTSVPIGGGGLFESSVELRAKVGKIKNVPVGGVAFLDNGDVRDSFSEIDFGNLHWAAGLGLRLFTLVGAIRFDVGYRLNRYGADEPEPGSRFAFHLSLGEAF